MKPDNFKLRELPLIEGRDPTWQTIEAWIEFNLARVRELREARSADLRSLDYNLGCIETLLGLQGLPDAIRAERKRDPVQDDANFNIPPP